MPFLIAGIVFAVKGLFATPALSPAIVFFIKGRYIEFNWLGAGVLVCFLYAILYFVSAKFLRVRISLGVSLFHLLVTLSAVIGLGQWHYMGVRTEQNPTRYNPTKYDVALAFFGVHAFTLLLVGGLLFLAIVMLSLLLKRKSVTLSNFSITRMPIYATRKDQFAEGARISEYAMPKVWS